MKHHMPRPVTLTSTAAAAAVTALLSLLLTACSKQDSPPPAAPQTGAPQFQPHIDPVEQQRKAEATRASSLPQADPNKPLESYHKLESGNELMMLFYAVSGLPLDMNEIAEALSQDYRRTQDGFKRQDILKVLEPRVKAQIAEAAQRRHVVWESQGSDLIERYDFQHRRFPVKSAYWNGDASFYFFDNNRHQISFHGASPVQALAVTDEAQARLIEDLLSRHQPLKLRIHAFVQDADLNRKTLRAQTVRLELLDPRGNVLASSGR